jgi:hypothetical protein
VVAIDDESDEMTRYGSRQLIPYVEILILCFIVRRPDGSSVPKCTQRRANSSQTMNSPINAIFVGMISTAIFHTILSDTGVNGHCISASIHAVSQRRL